MKVITEKPVAIDSPDHLFPWGTAADNHTNLGFIQEVEKWFNNEKISFIDIGCSGGQLAVDFNNRGHKSIGIEGSDYSVVNKRANWPAFHNKVLFTCDASAPYQVVEDDGVTPVKFDCVSSWECIEHIHPDQLDQFFTNISNHMHENSIFVGSISLVSDKHTCGGRSKEPVELHQSLFPENTWVNEILAKHFTVESYPFSAIVRPEPTSFYIKCTKKVDTV